MLPQYIILFDKPIRLGTLIGESVGPFVSIGDALEWLRDEFAVELPSHQILSILPPEA